MNKKLIVGCMIALVIFGLLSYLFSGFQEEAKINWTQFLVQNNIDKEMISRLRRNLTRNIQNLFSLALLQKFIVLIQRLSFKKYTPIHLRDQPHTHFTPRQRGQQLMIIHLCQIPDMA